MELQVPGMGSEVWGWGQESGMGWGWRGDGAGRTRDGGQGVGTELGTRAGDMCRRTGTHVALEMRLGTPLCLSFLSWRNCSNRSFFLLLKFFFTPLSFPFSLLSPFPVFPRGASQEPAGPFPSPDSGLSAPQPPAPPKATTTGPPSLGLPLPANWEQTGTATPALSSSARDGGGGHPMDF